MKGGAEPWCVQITGGSRFCLKVSSDLPCRSFALFHLHLTPYKMTGNKNHTCVNWAVKLHYCFSYCTVLRVTMWGSSGGPRNIQTPRNAPRGPAQFWRAFPRPKRSRNTAFYAQTERQTGTHRDRQVLYTQRQTGTHRDRQVLYTDRQVHIETDRYT